MTYPSSKHLIAFAFLIITLATGLWQGKRIKDFYTYAFGGSGLHLGALTLSFITTFIGAGDLEIPFYTYAVGLSASLEVVGYMASLFLLGYWLTPRLVHYYSCKTVGDLMGFFYGNAIRIFTGAVGALFCVVVAAAQLRALSQLLGVLFQSDPAVILLYSTGLLLLYMLSGGLRSVSFSDIIQLLTISVIVALVANQAVVTLLQRHQLADLAGLFRYFKQHHPEKLTFLRHPQFGFIRQDVLFWGICPTFLLSPPFIQRLLRIKQPAKGYMLCASVAGFYFVFRIFLALIGLSALLLLPAKLSGGASSLLAEIVTHLFKDNLVQGFIVVGIISVILSTADSFLHAGSVLLIHDVAAPLLLQKGRGISKPLSWARFTAVLLVLASAMLASCYQGFATNLLFYSIAALSLFTVPLLAGILGLKVGRWAFWGTLFNSLLAVLSAYYWSPLHYYLKTTGSKAYPATLYNLWLFVIVVNLISFFVFTYWEMGGFLRRVTTLNGPPSWGGWYHVQGAWTFLTNLNGMATQKLKQIGSHPLRFTQFVLLFAMIPTWRSNFTFIASIRAISVLLCSGLLTRACWPERLRKYFALYYFFTLCYCLVFSSMLLLLTSGGSSIAATIFSTSLLVLLILVDWKTFIALSLTGGGAAILLHYNLYGELLSAFEVAQWWDLVIKALFVLLTGLLFIQKQRSQVHILTVRQQQNGDVVDKKQTFLSFLQQDAAIAQPGGRNEGINLAEQLMGISQLLAEKDSKSLASIAQRASRRLAALATQLEEVSRPKEGNLGLQIEEIAITKLIEEVKESLVEEEVLPKVPQLYLQVTTPHVALQCDITLIKKLLRNAITASASYKATGTAYIEIASAQLAYTFPATPEQTKKIEALRFSISNRPYTTTLPTCYSGSTRFISSLPVGHVQDTPQLENERIVDAHGGVCAYMEAGDAFVQVYVVPRSMQALHPAVTSLPAQAATQTLLTTQDSERTLLSAIAHRAKGVTLTKVKKAIALIKKHHAFQKRKSGEAFYLHPMAVAMILLDFTQEEEVILAALLHDITKSTTITFSQVSSLVGPDVAQLVEAVNKLDRGARSLHMRTADELRAFVAIEDSRALTIKIADRIHNMRTIYGHPSLVKQRRVAKETLQFFLPLAKAIGLVNAAEELEALARQVLEE